MPIQITSLRNPRVKEAAALREARERRQRQEMIIDGVREIRRACEAGIKLKEVFFCASLLTSEGKQLLSQVSESETELFEVTSRVFEKLNFGDRQDGIVAVAATPQRSLAEIEDQTGTALVAILEAIEKPGNLGAIIRTADGAGLSGVIAADLRTDLYNPNTIRASLGTIFSMPVVAMDSRSAREWALARGLQLVAARVEGTIRYDQVDFTRPTGIVLGNEATGLTPIWKRADVLGVRIPMLGQADSLNVSVAAAILFYEAQRQRGFPIPARRKRER
ncbi:MAG TPA: RNA methyltransferase [Thermogutta sp.]|nr:RNA methyltransferase [Thermogutta sp.]HOP77707.1 RNA methyltransferase [Thermogutta sp.]HPU06694.1 RNA methyltransferase [Thermogutta sp.]HPZ82164.1 RNA methyltransferase [Thermogutta sp.]HQF12538.1 RNA methyltransferase [Thermogutta sp.]